MKVQNGTAPPREIKLEATILETAMSGLAVGFAAYAALGMVWAFGLGIDWLLRTIPGLGWVAFAVLLGSGFLAGVWYQTVGRR